MVATKWGEIYLPEQRKPFIKITIDELNQLVGKVQELELAPVWLKTHIPWLQVEAYGYKAARQYLFIEERGLAIFVRYGGFFNRQHATRLVMMDELPKLLEDYQFGLGDVDKLFKQVDTIKALRKLMSMPEVKRLLHPLPIKTDKDSNLKQTKEGLVCKGLSGPSTKYRNPKDINLKSIRWIPGLKPEYVNAAIAKLQTSGRS